MATVFAPVAMLTAEEVERGTRVTYLGQVHGMMSALKRMRVRNRGTIVNVGSALAYRSVPLQSIYCGAKAAIRGFTDSLRSEIIHDKLDVHLTMVDLPAVNTPAVRLGAQQDGAQGQAGRADLRARSPGPRHLFRRHAQATRHLGRLADGQGDPRQPHRPGPDRSLSRHGRLFRPACRPSRPRPMLPPTYSSPSPAIIRRTAASTLSRATEAGRCSLIATRRRSSRSWPCWRSD